MVAAEPRTRYSCKRHWFEIVAELSDFIWWSSIIIAISIALAEIIDKRAGWLVFLCLYPLGHVVAEVIKWNLDWYAIVDMPNGKSMFRQTTYVITLFGLNERVKNDYIDHLAPTTLTTAFGRRIGFQSVVMSSSTKAYFDGERVPMKLMEEFQKFPRKPRQEPFDNERAMLAAHASEWVQNGIIEPVHARALVAGMIQDNIT